VDSLCASGRFSVEFYFYLSLFILFLVERTPLNIFSHLLNLSTLFYTRKTTATPLFSNFYQPISESLLGVDCSNVTASLSDINSTVAALVHTTGGRDSTSFTCLKCIAHYSRQQRFDRILSLMRWIRNFSIWGIVLGLVNSQGWLLNYFSEAPLIKTKTLKFLAVTAKHRWTAYEYSPFIANLLAALHSLWIFLYFVWSAGRRSLLWPIGHVSVGMVLRHICKSFSQ